MARLLAAATGVAAAAIAQERESVTFSLNPGALAAGHSVYVVGDRPELGANDVTRAVKLADVGSGWRVAVELPVNTTFGYRFYDRDDDPLRIPDPTNAAPLSGALSGSTALVALTPGTKRLVCHTDLSAPQLFWRQGGGGFTRVAMTQVGAGRTPAEGRYEVPGFAAARRPVEFYLTDGARVRRDPATGTYDTPLDAAFLQDGHLFTYAPAPNAGPQRRDYNPAAPPVIASAVLGENRPYRVMLPRGYDQHPTRRYPVLFGHDGWLWFDDGAASVDLDGQRLAELTRTGAIEELIFVGVDHVAGTSQQVFFTNRFRDYIPPGDWARTPWGLVAGKADRYAAFLVTELLPLIAAKYRTRGGPASTWTCGFSAGGVVSAYLGWDFGTTFGGAGSFSGAFEVPNFLARVALEPKRPTRFYLDCGTVNDYYPYTLRLYDSLIDRPSPWVVEQDLRFTLGFGHTHTTVDVAKRFPGFLEFVADGGRQRNEWSCATVPYGGGLGGTQTLALRWQSAAPGSKGALEVTGAGGGSIGLLGLTLGPARLPVFGITLLIDLQPIAVTLPLAFDAGGRAAPPFDLGYPQAAGHSLFSQAFELRPGALFASNGLELRLCR